MKKMVAAVVAVAAFTGSALAADLPARTYTKAPAMPEPVYNWTGFYIFGGAGGGVWDARQDVVLNGVSITNSQREGGDGWFGTVGAGYDWQFNRSWVAGIFADGQFGGLRGSFVENNNGVVGNETLRNSWAAGARLGYLVAPNAYSYVNAGFTESYWSGSALGFVSIGSTPAVFDTVPSFHRGGWFVGGGFENNLNIFGITAPGLFMKTEYRAAYYDRAALPETLAVGPSAGFVFSQTPTFKPFVQTISTSLVYRFNSGGTGSALAADMSAAPLYTKARVTPVYDWTGFYVFGGGGGGVWDAKEDSVTNPGGVLITNSQRQGGDGWFGTVGAGYDWQFNHSWVAGVFGDGQFGSLRGSLVDGNAATVGTETLRDSWAAGARLGYLVAPMVLSYVNAGYTQSNWSGSLLAQPIAGASPAFSFNTPSFNRGGWFVGGGVENNLNIFGITAPGWFMKTEYRAAHYDRVTLPETFAAGPSAGQPFDQSTTFKPLVQTISTSIVYRFNWGGPVVAKY